MVKIALKVITEDNEEAEFIPDFFSPLPFKELVSKNSHYPMKVKVSAGNLKINGEVQDKNFDCNFNIAFNEDVTIFVLVMGGWLPFTCLNSAQFIPDRNVISTIKEIKSGKIRKNSKKTEWWLSFLKEANLVTEVSCKIR